MLSPAAYPTSLASDSAAASPSGGRNDDQTIDRGPGHCRPAHDGNRRVRQRSVRPGGDPEPAGPDQYADSRHATEDPDVVREPAPIESVRVVVKDSREYSLLIVSGLPDSCAKFESYELNRDGSLLEVTVTNLSPSGPFACLAVYEIHEGELPLGSDFTPGEEYTVVVNGQVTETFTAR